MSLHIELIAKLDNFANRLVYITDIDLLVKTSGEIIDEIVDVEYSGLYLIDHETKKLTLSYSKGFTEEEKAEAVRTVMDRHPGWVIRNNKILNIADVDNDPDNISSDSKRRLHVRSRLWLPVIMRGESVGAFGFSSSKPNQFTEEHIALLRFVTNVVSVVYVNIQYKLEQEIVKYNLERSIEEIKRAKELKEKFLANMSHEIRTPMNAVMGMSDLLKNTKLDKDQRFYLEAISISSEHLLELLNDILDFSKIDAGQLTIEKIPFSIRTSFERIQHALHLKIDEKHLIFHSYVDERIHQKLIGDPLRFTQVITNLLGNSIKFTSQGNISLAAKLVHDDDSNQIISFSVSDSGIGIDNEKLESIFDSFKQEDDSITRKYGGSGLGLAISKEIVELMGGTISVESEKGLGTKFSVQLSFPKSIEINSAEQKQEPNTTKPLLENSVVQRSLDILVVEDDKLNMFYASAVLTKLGHRVDEAMNGIIAIEKIKLKKYDIILMDMQMPEMDGLTATRIIRTELHNEVPIIALTANAIKGDYERCIEAGMNDYVSKPLNVEYLKMKILKWTSN